MSEELIVKPAAGKHAIEVMALGVEWARPLSQDALRRVELHYEASEPLRAFLPRREAIKGLTVNFDDQGTRVSAPELGGLQLSRHREDGRPSWVVHVRPELLSCSCLDYDRWDSVKPKALEVLLPFIELAAADGRPIQAIGLQYQDAFRVPTTSHTEATRRMFQQHSRWLSPQVWAEGGPWHIHQGWFSPGTEGRVVHNLLNVDVVGESQDCLFRINGQHRELAVSRNGVEIEPLKQTDVSYILDALHSSNKHVLSGLLNKSVCDQIGLNFSEA